MTLNDAKELFKPFLEGQIQHCIEEDSVKLIPVEKDNKIKLEKKIILGAKDSFEVKHLVGNYFEAKYEGYFYNSTFFIGTQFQIDLQSLTLLIEQENESRNDKKLSPDKIKDLTSPEGIATILNHRSNFKNVFDCLFGDLDRRYLANELVKNHTAISARRFGL